MTEAGRVAGVRTDRGVIKSPRVLMATGGYGVLTAAMVGLRLPINVLTIQAMVSQRSSRSCTTWFLPERTIVIATRASKANWSPEPTWMPGPITPPRSRPVFETSGRGFVRTHAVSEGAPVHAHLVRLADMTPDMAPIMDGHIPVKGLYIDTGWGYFGFKSGPIAGKYMARFMAQGECPDILKPFALNRFEQFRLQGETASPISYGPWN